MLDSLKAMVLKRSPTVTPAEQALETVEEGARDRAARLLAEEKAARQAERQEKLDELAQLDTELEKARQRKAALLRIVRGHFTTLVPILTELDELEAHGTRLSSQAFNLALDCGGELRSGWRDPVLPGVSHLLTNWLRKLEA
jgi:phosphoglycolate phosphatase-like HAD superfamily hydrolase